MGLFGALTHQAMAVALPVRKPAAGIVTRFARCPPPDSHGHLHPLCAHLLRRVLYLHAVSHRHPIPLESAHYYKTGGFFDFKEHVATLGFVLLPAYWYFWKNAQNPEYDNARKGVTLVLAVIVWFLFIVGHVLNNTRGFAS